MSGNMEILLECEMDGIKKLGATYSDVSRDVTYWY